MTLPLWPGDNPVQSTWDKVRAGWAQAGPGWQFWIDWYDAALRGQPLDPDLLTEIALLGKDDDYKIWEDEDALLAQIAGIYEAYQKESKANVTSKLSDSAAQALSEIPLSSVRRAIDAHREVLPPTLEAICGLISEEVHRLQSRNYQSNEEMEECKRLIAVFSQLHEAVSSLTLAIPVQGEARDADAEQARSAFSVYSEASSTWLRESAPDVVGSTFRIGLTGLTAAPLIYFGVPPHVAFLVTGLSYGGPKLKDGIKDIASAIAKTPTAS